MLGKNTSHSDYEEVLPKYTQNNVIAGCHTHSGPAGAMGQAHQINLCHTRKQAEMNQGLSGGSGNKITMHLPHELAPPNSSTANNKANVKAAGGTLLNVHQNDQQTCGPNSEYCKNLGDAEGTQQEGGSKKTKKKHHKKRKQNRKTKKINRKTKKNRNSNKNRKIKGILKKTKNSKISNKNKKSKKTKKVRFHK